jgi:hypothetical protein
MRSTAAGYDSRAVWDGLCGAIIKSLLTVQPILAQAYAQSQPCVTAPSSHAAADAAPFRCFELLGYDFMLDTAARPWLIEVNHSPSFNIDTPLDRVVKVALIVDTLRLVRIDAAAVRRAQNVCLPISSKCLPWLSCQLHPCAHHLKCFHCALHMHTSLCVCSNSNHQLLANCEAYVRCTCHHTTAQQGCN